MRNKCRPYTILLPSYGLREGPEEFYHNGQKEIAKFYRILIFDYLSSDSSD